MKRLVRLGALLAVLLLTTGAAAPAPGAAAGAFDGNDEADLFNERGYLASSAVVPVTRDEMVSTFSGNLVVRKSLLSLPGRGGLPLDLDLVYNAATGHRRIDMEWNPAIGAWSVHHGAASFGEWWIGLNGLAILPFHFGVNLANDPSHTDAWRVDGFSISDRGYFPDVPGAHNVYIALADGTLAEFRYPEDDPGLGPALLPHTRGQFWRAHLPRAVAPGRTLWIQRPDGSTLRYVEVPLRFPFLPPNPDSWYVHPETAPTSFRLASIATLAGDSVTVAYEYGASFDPGDGFQSRYLHPTRVRVRDTVGRELVLDVDVAAGVVTVDPSAFDLGTIAIHFERRLDPLTGRRPPIASVTRLLDAVSRETRFEYEPDTLRVSALVNGAGGCLHSFRISAPRLVRVRYPTGGHARYRYVTPIPPGPPCSPPVSPAQMDGFFQVTGRSAHVSPIVSEVAIFRGEGEAGEDLVSRTICSYAWNATGEGVRLNSVDYLYTTEVRTEAGPATEGTPRESSRTYRFRKYPYATQSFASLENASWEVKLLRVDGPEGRADRFEYDLQPVGNGLFTGTFLPTGVGVEVPDDGPGGGTAGFFVETAFDTLGNWIRQVDPFGTVTRRVPLLVVEPWNASNPAASRYFTNAILAESTFAETNPGAPLRLRRWEVDPATGNRLAEEIREGPGRFRRVAYEYDPLIRSRRVARVEPDGARVEYRYDAPSSVEPEEEVRWSGSRELVRRRVLNPAGAPLEIRDPSGNATRFTYDAAGRLLAIDLPGSGRSAEWVHADPNRTRVRRNFGDFWTETEIETDGLDRVVRRSRVAPSQARETGEYGHDLAGAVAREVDPAGRTILRESDALGRETALVFGDGSRATTEYRWTSDPGARGYLLPAGFHRLSFLEVRRRTDGSGHAVERCFDAAGRLRIVGYFGAPAEPSGALAGSPERAAFYDYDARGDLVAVQDTEGRLTRYEYDEAGGLARLDAPDAGEGYLLEGISLAGTETRTFVPEGPRLQWECDLGESGKPTESFTIREPGTGRVLVRVTGHGLRFGSIPDAMPGVPLEATLASVPFAFATADVTFERRGFTGTWDWVFLRDRAGRLRFRQGPLQRARGNAWTYWKYDPLGREVETGEVVGTGSEVDPDDPDAPSGAASASFLVRRSYDVGANALGRLHQVEVSRGGFAGTSLVRTYDYDRDGRVIRAAHAFGTAAGSMPVEYEYLPSGACRSVRYPDGTRAETVYDGFGRPERLLAAGGANPVARFERGPDGRPARLHLAGGVVQEWEYDARGLVARESVVGDGGRLLDLRYAHAGDGTPVAALDEGGEGWEFGIDPRDRLGRATAKQPFRDAHLRYGDRSPFSPAALETLVTPFGLEIRRTAAGSSRVERIEHPPHGETLYGYDPDGNVATRVVRRGSTTLETLVIERDAFGRETRSTFRSTARAESSLTVRDERGLAVVRTRNGSTRTEVLAEDGRPLLATGPTGTIHQRVLHLGRLPVSLLDVAGREHALVWDARGDLRLAIGPEGLESERLEFDPYGREAALAGVDRMPVGFAGRQRSPSTSTLDFGVRSYDPASGRFLEPDPALLGAPPEAILADPRQLGAYLYASENPVVGTDRLGLETYFVNGINYNAARNPYGETFTAALEARGVEGVHFVEAFEEGGFLRDVVEAAREMFLLGGERWELTGRVRRDVSRGALSPGEPLNLVGYSAGGAVVANAALQLLRMGIPVTTVVVIGSPVSARRLEDLERLGVRVSIIRNPGDYVGVQSLLDMVLFGLSHASREAHREYDWDRTAERVAEYLEPWNAEHREPPIRRGE